MVHNSQANRHLTISADTIAAIATPAGIGGIGIVRVSGPQAPEFAEHLTGVRPTPRRAMYRNFVDGNGRILDQGILLYFARPYSYTGEDLCEFQCHGSPVVLNLVLQRLLQLGARTAEPGEFTKRAFLNDKIDLAQAEAVVDLINSTTAAAARSAMCSLRGEFSEKIHDIQEQLLQIRMFVEAAIDFPEEEIDFLSDLHLLNSVEKVRRDLDDLLTQSTQGCVLREGVSVVIAGLPNAGKSSLLNRLSGEDRVIVAPLAGTTRDTVDITIDLDGLAVRLIDTAGLRESDDYAEKEGIRRTWNALAEADIVLYVIDCQLGMQAVDRQNLQELNASNLVILWNKIDLDENFVSKPNIYQNIRVSALNGSGFYKLRETICKLAGYDKTEEGVILARRRHLQAIRTSREFVVQASNALVKASAGELAAQDLKDAMEALGQIVGNISADDLLGEIFAKFCIGK